MTVQLDNINIIITNIVIGDIKLLLLFGLICFAELPFRRETGVFAFCILQILHTSAGTINDNYEQFCCEFVVKQFGAIEVRS